MFGYNNRFPLSEHFSKLMCSSCSGLDGWMDDGIKDTGQTETHCNVITYLEALPYTRIWQEVNFQYVKTKNQRTSTLIALQGM